jgi:hypothetical protein
MRNKSDLGKAQTFLFNHHSTKQFEADVVSMSHLRVFGKVLMYSNGGGRSALSSKSCDLLKSAAADTAAKE